MSQRYFVKVPDPAVRLSLGLPHDVQEFGWPGATLGASDHVLLSAGSQFIAQSGGAMTLQSKAGLYTYGASAAYASKGELKVAGKQVVVIAGAPQGASPAKLHGSGSPSDNAYNPISLMSYVQKAAANVEDFLGQPFALAPAGFEKTATDVHEALGIDDPAYVKSDHKTWGIWGMRKGPEPITEFSPYENKFTGFVQFEIDWAKAMASTALSILDIADFYLGAADLKAHANKVVDHANKFRNVAMALGNVDNRMVGAWNESVAPIGAAVHDRQATVKSTPATWELGSGEEFNLKVTTDAGEEQEITITAKPAKVSVPIASFAAGDATYKVNGDDKSVTIPPQGTSSEREHGVRIQNLLRSKLGGDVSVALSGSAIDIESSRRGTGASLSIAGQSGAGSGDVANSDKVTYDEVAGLLTGFTHVDVSSEDAAKPTKTKSSKTAWDRFGNELGADGWQRDEKTKKVVLKSKTKGEGSEIAVEGSLADAIGLGGASDAIGPDPQWDAWVPLIQERVDKTKEAPGAMLAPIVGPLEDLAGAVTETVDIVNGIIDHFKNESSDPPPLGLFAKGLISIVSGRKIHAAASKGFMFVADDGGGKLEEAKPVGKQLDLLNKFKEKVELIVEAATLRKFVKEAPKEKEPSIGFQVRATTDIHMESKLLAHLAAVGDKALARVASAATAEVVGGKNVVLGARATDGALEAFADSIAIGTHSADDLKECSKAKDLVHDRAEGTMTAIQTAEAKVWKPDAGGAFKQQPTKDVYLGASEKLRMHVGAYLVEIGADGVVIGSDDGKTKRDEVKVDQDNKPFIQLKDDSIVLKSKASGGAEIELKDAGITLKVGANSAIELKDSVAQMKFGSSTIVKVSDSEASVTFGSNKIKVDSGGVTEKGGSHKYG